MKDDIINNIIVASIETGIQKIIEEESALVAEKVKARILVESAVIARTVLSQLKFDTNETDFLIRLTGSPKQ